MSGSAGHTVGSCPLLVYGQVDLYPALATGHLANVPSVTEFLGPHGPENLKVVMKRSRYQTPYCYRVTIRKL